MLLSSARSAPMSGPFSASAAAEALGELGAHEIWAGIASSGYVASWRPPSVRDKQQHNRPQAREGLTVSIFPNGDTPERATNDVTANSRDQVNLPGTKHHSDVGHLDLRPDLTISSHDASASP